MKGAAEGLRVWIIPVENQIRTDSSGVDIYLLLVEKGGGMGQGGGREGCGGERRKERGGSGREGGEWMRRGWSKEE